MTGDEREFETLQVHAGYTPDATHSRVTPLYQTTAYTFDSAEHGADLFALRESGNIYTRLQNPTTDMLEKRVAALEGGPAALAVSSGHSAQLVALTSILSPGDNFVSSPYLYGGTHNQFKIVLRNFGLECRFAPDNDPQKYGVRPHISAFSENIETGQQAAPTLEHRELKQQQGERQTDQILVLLVEILEHGRRELFFLDLVDFLHDLV